jgi:hypothetical protein
MGEMRNIYKFLAGKQRGYLGDISVDGRIILKWNLKNTV